LVNNALILGGTGFIGKDLLSFLNSKNIECTTLSRNSFQFQSDLFPKEHIQADITDFKNLKKVLYGRQFKYVVNLSGSIDHSPLTRGGIEVINSHFIGVQNLLRALDKSSLECFIQIGSSDEYGNMSSPQYESSRESPISPYSLAKTASTQMLQMLYRTEDFPVVILRFFLVYGGGQANNRFLPQVIKGCLNNQKFPVSKGEQLRDFCYLSDISRGIYAALIEKKALGEVINLASGSPISIKKLIENVNLITGKGRPQFGEILYRKGENMSLYADISKAKRLLNWEPKIDLNQGLRNTVAWYEQNN